jgi:hypothetical protein
VQVRGIGIGVTLIEYPLKLSEEETPFSLTFMLKLAVPLKFEVMFIKNIEELLIEVFMTWFT